MPVKPRIAECNAMAPIDATTKKIAPSENSQTKISYFFRSFTSAGIAAARGGFTPRPFRKPSTCCADELTSKPKTFAPSGRLLFAHKRPMPMIMNAVTAKMNNE
jgi:hypothetical protein